MEQIIDRSQEFYPNLQGAEYLEFKSPNIPQGLTISKSNVSQTRSGKLVVSPFGSYWGWSFKNSFHRNFKTPEEALNHFLKVTNNG